MGGSPAAAPPPHQAPAADRTADVIAAAVVAAGPPAKKTSRTVSDDAEWAATVLAWVLDDVAGTPHDHESGLTWAAAVLGTGGSRQLVVTTSDAGWMPPAARLPRGVRLVVRHPDADSWAAVADPVRPLLEIARAEDLDVRAIATTHESRAHIGAVAPAAFIGVDHAARAPETERRASRVELLVSEERRDLIASLDDTARRDQMLACVDDAVTSIPDRTLSTSAVAAIDVAATTVLDCLRAGEPAPARALAILASAWAELVDADRRSRRDTRAYPVVGTMPDRRDLAAIRLACDAAEATIAVAVSDEATVLAAWTAARVRAALLGVQPL